MKRGILSILRDAVHGSAERRAVQAEQHAVDAHVAREAQLETRLREVYGTSGRGAVTLGRAVEYGWDVLQPAERLRAHALLVGPSGCGKSWLAVLILKALLESGFRAVVLDPKAETIELGVAATAVAIRKMSSGSRSE